MTEGDVDIVHWRPRSGISLGRFLNWVRGDQYNSIQITSNNHYCSSLSDDQILAILAERAAPNAAYHARQRNPTPQCHPSTRRGILTHLHGWDEESQYTGPRLCWAYGGVNVGKSTICRTFARDCANKGRLAATFFMSREDPTRNHAERFPATVAYQLCTLDNYRHILRPLILRVVRDDPLIFQSQPHHQFRKLVLEPLRSVATHRDIPHVIIIDALDTCHSRHIMTFLEMIGLACSFSQNRLAFVIFSQDEPYVRRGLLENTDFTPTPKLLPISYESFTTTGQFSEVDDDVKGYFESKFQSIRERSPVLPTTWPSAASLEVLVRRASGQFGYANAVIRYVDVYDHRPQDRLEELLSGKAGRSAFRDLDASYRRILSDCKQNWSRICPILRFLITPRHHSESLNSPQSVSTIECLFKLKPGGLRPLFSRLYPVARIVSEGGAPGEHCEKVQILHYSFAEFLSDSARSGRREFFAPGFSSQEHSDILRGGYVVPTAVSWCFRRC